MRTLHNRSEKQKAREDYSAEVSCEANAKEPHTRSYKGETKSRSENKNGSRRVIMPDSSPVGGQDRDQSRKDQNSSQTVNNTKNSHRAFMPAVPHPQLRCFFRNLAH